MKLSKTQLSNVASFAGLLVLILQQAGITLEANVIAFWIAAGWSTLWTAYNYWQRYKKGDLTLAGVRK